MGGGIWKVLVIGIGRGNESYFEEEPVMLFNCIKIKDELLAHDVASNRDASHHSDCP